MEVKPRIFKFSATLHFEDPFWNPAAIKVSLGEHDRPSETIVQRVVIVERGVPKLSCFEKLMTSCSDRFMKANHITLENSRRRRLPKTVVYANRKQLVDFLAIFLLKEGTFFWSWVCI